MCLFEETIEIVKLEICRFRNFKTIQLGPTP